MFILSLQLFQFFTGKLQAAAEVQTRDYGSVGFTEERLAPNLKAFELAMHNPNVFPVASY